MLPSTSDTTERTSTTESSTRWRLESEDLHIRNHDQETAYEIEITIRQGDTLHHRAEYHLLPDQSGSSVTLLPAGTYDVTVQLGSGAHTAGQVRVSDEPDETIAVEIINGNARLTEGVQ